MENCLAFICRSWYNWFDYLMKYIKRAASRLSPETEWGENPRERVTVMPGKPDKSDTSGRASVPAHTGKLRFYETEQLRTAGCRAEFFRIGSRLTCQRGACPLLYSIKYEVNYHEKRNCAVSYACADSRHAPGDGLCHGRHARGRGNQGQPLPDQRCRRPDGLWRAG